jgi:hypothetical protein
MLKAGWWYLHSKKDPRWNASGRAMVGLFATPKEAEQKIAELTERFGQPPDDLEAGYEKE